MKILWITNNLFPEAQQLLTSKPCSNSGSGGWLLGLANMLVRNEDLELTIASLSEAVSELTRLKGERISYYILPFGKGNVGRNREYEPFWRQVRDELMPDVVHLHGTEFSHGLAYIEACGADNVCVSIQGMTSVIKDYFRAGLSTIDILKASTFGTAMFGGILSTQKDLSKRSECETEIIRRVGHVIGRTTWDRAHTWAINPSAKYYYGGETLREEFYQNHCWTYDKCIPHSIFLSQAGTPLKGLHMMLNAMPLILRHFPDSKIRIAGGNICANSGFKRKLLGSDYGNIISGIMKKYQLSNCITFTGSLNAEGMRKEYLNCNVFVCPSSIENSPNSLAEAQVLGTPVVASYAGGIPDMMKGNEEYLYRYEDYGMLAYKICRIFEQNSQINTGAMRQQALLRHNTENIVQEQMNIYRIISRL